MRIQEKSKKIEAVTLGKAAISNVTRQECLQTIRNAVEKGQKIFIVTPNVDHIVKLEKDTEFLEIYNEADLVLADGMPLMWAAKLLGTPIKEKISGSDIFPQICEMSSQRAYNVFFLGGMEGVAELAAINLKKQLPKLNVVGTYSPPFGFEKNSAENEKIINMVNNSNTHILFVGVGAPKQEKWIFNNIDRLNINVAIGIGASFDFAAGTIKRAPKLLQDAGLEWFWRFLHEPRRLFKRYFIDDSRFLLIVSRQILKRMKAEAG